MLLATTVASAGETSGLVDRESKQLPRGQAEAIEFIQQRVPVSEKIFVGNVKHDVSSRNDAMFYFLSGRENATRYDELFAYQVNRRSVQEEILSDIEANGVNYIVLFSGLFDVREPNPSSMTGGATLLDDFISRRYGLEAQFGSYAIWAKR
jgi:hypothetical protein